jgi:hypothetical protein
VKEEEKSGRNILILLILIDLILVVWEKKMNSRDGRKLWDWEKKKEGY